MHIQEKTDPFGVVLTPNTDGIFTGLTQVGGIYVYLLPMGTCY